jgi:excisionase family DNA binding protein
MDSSNGLARPAAGGSHDSRPWVRCADEVARRITDGRYGPGEWLPAPYALAGELELAYEAVVMAYGVLGSKGLITEMTGNGYYVGVIPPRGLPGGAESATLPRRGGAVPARQDGGLLGEELMTVAEFAGIVRVSVMTVYRMIRQEEIDAVRVSSHTIRIIRSSAEEYLRRNRLTSA